jgi:hypothetical protein
MVQVDERLHTVTCSHCLTCDPIPRRIQFRPDMRFEFLELWALNHSECEDFSDARMARNNIKFRKESKRLLLLQGKRQAAFQAV